MASNTPWILRASDPMWREDHDYKKGHRICGSDGAIYIARKDSGPNTEVGAQNPVTETSGDYWISLADSLKSNGANELTGATTAKKLETPRIIDGVAFDGSTDISNYAVCDTQSSAQTKAVTITNFNLVKGASARINFTNGNTHTSPTLDISGTGARELRLNNEPVKDYFIDKNGTYDIVYDGTYYQIVNGGVNTQAPKAVQLSTIRSIQGLGFDGTRDIYNYTECGDDASTIDKKVNLSGFILAKGSVIKIKFLKGNTASAPTLNINNTGAKSIKWHDEDLKSYYIDANGIYDFIYDGEYFQLTSSGPTEATNSAKQLTDPRTINGITFDGSKDISNYGTCDTASDSNKKTVSIPGYTVIEGSSIRIKFTNGNSTTTPTLNVNGTGAIPLKYNNANLDNNSITTNGIYDVIYDGTCYQIVNGGITPCAPTATKLATARNINGVMFDGSNNVSNYGVCDTASNVVNKTVSIANFALAKGARATIKFTKGNSCQAPTLNINNTGIKILKYNDTSILDYYIVANGTYEVIYDGTYYQLLGSVSTTSTTTTISSNTDISSITKPGEYVSTNTNCTTEKGYPYNTTGKNVSITINVGTNTQYVCQTINIDKSVWHRFSNNGGKTWEGWHPTGGTIDELGTVYLALTGDDKNTGLNSKAPVRTVERALEICRNVHMWAKEYNKLVGLTGGIKNNLHRYCVLSFGAGNWDTLNLTDLNFNVVLKGTNYNADTNAYNSSMPYFSRINVFRCRAVDLCGICFGKIYAVGNGTVVYQAGYIRCRSICMREYAQFVVPFSHFLDFYNYTVAHIDSNAIERERDSCFYVSAGGKIVFYWGQKNQQKIRIISNINLGNYGAFLYCTETDSRFATACNFIDHLQVNSGCTVTGIKYYICNHDMDYPGITKAQADKLPGTKAGTYACGRIVLSSSVSGTQWWRKWSDGWIEQGGLVTRFYISQNYNQSKSFTFNTAFTNANSINLRFSVTRQNDPGYNNVNWTDDTIVYERTRWTTGYTVGVWDFGTYDGKLPVYVSFYWYACGY